MKDHSIVCENNFQRQFKVTFELQIHSSIRSLNIKLVSLTRHRNVPFSLIYHILWLQCLSIMSFLDDNHDHFSLVVMSRNCWVISKFLSECDSEKDILLGLSMSPLPLSTLGDVHCIFFKEVTQPGFLIRKLLCCNFFLLFSVWL